MSSPESPRFIAGSTAVPMRCPACASDRILRIDLAGRVCGIAGAALGATAATGTVQRIGTHAYRFAIDAAKSIGRPRAAIGQIAQATLRAMTAAATGCTVGAQLGAALDAHVLANHRCLHCGLRFGVKPS